MPIDKWLLTVNQMRDSRIDIRSYLSSQAAVYLNSTSLVDVMNWGKNTPELESSLNLEVSSTVRKSQGTWNPFENI